MSEKLHWHYCRVCGALGRIDDDQVAGRVSIQCPNDDCDGHYTLIPNPRTIRDTWDIRQGAGGLYFQGENVK